MLFTKVLLAATACAVASAAKFGMTGAQFDGVTTGSIFNISWFEASGPVTLILKNGEANVLKTVFTIASGLTGTSYAWTIPSTLPVDYYAFEIDDSTPPNYSGRFLITGGPALSSSSTSGASSATSSAKTSGSSSSTTSGSSASTSAATTAAASNSTTSTGTHTSTTASSKTSSSSSSSTTPSSVSSAAGVASPLAFVLLAFAAIMTLN